MPAGRTPQRSSLVANGDPEVRCFAEAIVHEAAALRMPDLRATRGKGVLHRVRNRHGVDVVVLRTTALRDSQLVGLLRYRLAQYLHLGFIDPRVVYERRLNHEPLSEVSAEDIHFVATSAATGELLCYAVLRSVSDAVSGPTLRSTVRPLLPLERAHGRGIFNRLSLLPDLPLIKVREVGRFVKNHHLASLGELAIRSPVELGLALFRTVLGPLRSEVEAVVGSLQEEVAKRNFDYFHIPMVVIRGTVPWTEEGSLLAPRYGGCATYPFAVLVGDAEAAGERLTAIEDALSRPGRDGVLALLTLRDQGSPKRSSLEPAGGLDPLARVRVAQQTMSTHARRELRELGGLLRQARPLQGLTDAEAAVLVTFMQRLDVPAGAVLIRQGEVGDDLFVVLSGDAEVFVRDPMQRPVSVGRLGPGDHFGEIALVMGGARSADVVALTPMTLMKITKELYRQYLGYMADVQVELHCAATSRLRDTQHCQSQASD